MKEALALPLRGGFVLQEKSTGRRFEILGLKNVSGLVTRRSYRLRSLDSEQERRIVTYHGTQEYLFVPRGMLTPEQRALLENYS